VAAIDERGAAPLLPDGDIGVGEGKVTKLPAVHEDAENYGGAEDGKENGNVAGTGDGNDQDAKGNEEKPVTAAKMEGARVNSETELVISGL